MSALEILSGARNILTDPARWVHHGPVAVNESGDPAGGYERQWDLGDEGDALAEDACAWCLVGACVKASGNPSLRFDDPELAPLRAAIHSPKYFDETFGMLLGQWNDAPERTHAEVLAALDKAIAIAEAS